MVIAVLSFKSNQVDEFIGVIEVFKPSLLNLIKDYIYVDVEIREGSVL